MTKQLLWNMLSFNNIFLCDWHVYKTKAHHKATKMLDKYVYYIYRRPDVTHCMTWKNERKTKWSDNDKRWQQEQQQQRPR